MPKTPTPNYTLGRWNDHEDPTADGLNGNWDKIDTAIKAALDAAIAAQAAAVAAQASADAAEQDGEDALVAAANAGDALDLKYFKDRGLMPTTKIFDAVSVFPAFDAAQVADGFYNAIAYLDTQAIIIGNGGNTPSNASWAPAGGPFTKMLLIFAAVIPNAVVTSTKVGIFLAKNAPPANSGSPGGSQPTNAYIARINSSLGQIEIVKTDNSGTETVIKTDSDPYVPDFHPINYYDLFRNTAAGFSVLGWALRADGVNVTLYLRPPGGTWFPAQTVADGTLTPLSDAGIVTVPSSDRSRTRYGGPVGLYVQA